MPDSENSHEKSDKLNEKRRFHKRRRFHKNRSDNASSGNKPVNQSDNKDNSSHKPQHTDSSPQHTKSSASQHHDHRKNHSTYGGYGGHGGRDNKHQSSSSHSGSSQHQSYRDRFDKNRHQSKHSYHREKAPAWTSEEFLKAKPLPETQEDLKKLLEEIDPEQLMMTPLVQKRKFVKSEENSVEQDELTDEKTKVTVDLVKNCPICDRPIREVMYALHDYDHDKLAHFDCVFRKVTETVKDKLINKRYLAYLGSGSFGIMEPIPNKPNKYNLIEKIYPGAPVEELLRADENKPDEEI